jgi:dTDP-4-dehydrorhamnose 3,5-epimerase
MPMHASPLGLPEVIEIVPDKYEDQRGFFSETYNERRFSEAGANLDWVQDNQSLSVLKGTLRGLHYQAPPFAQDKLVRVVRGAIFDVAVDIRHGSPRFGHWCSCIISAERWNQLLVPKGFAHGFVTLEPNTEVIYKVSEFYDRDHDRAINYADSDIGVEWPVEGDLLLSAKDQAAPALRDVDTGFIYEADGGSAN